MNVIESRTTQNVVFGVGSVGAAIMAVLAVVRGVAPDLLWWDAESDARVVFTAMAVLGPLVSRAFALWRTPEKRDAP